LDDHPPAIIASDLDMRQSAVEKHVFRAQSDIRQGLAKRGLAGWSRI
jgi:RNA polymerase sigma-70 factor (ECF subfamily)